MKLDLFVDTSRKGISMGLSDSTSGLYQETVDASARGETASAILDDLLARVGAKLDDISECYSLWDRDPLAVSVRESLSVRDFALAANVNFVESVPCRLWNALAVTTIQPKSPW